MPRHLTILWSLAIPPAKPAPMPRLAKPATLDSTSSTVLAFPPALQLILLTMVNAPHAAQTARHAQTPRLA